jgi:hypothetical protein
MSLDMDRQARVRALIPRGSAAQTIFRDATALAYAQGLGIADAVEFGIEQARRSEPDFEPAYDVALLALDAP